MQIARLNFVSSLAIVAALAVGCSSRTVAPTPVGPANPGVVDDPGSTTTPDAGVPARYAGIYEADAQLDFTQPGVLPGLASPALAALSNVGTDPGTALVSFAQAAGAINLGAPSSRRSSRSSSTLSCRTTYSTGYSSSPTSRRSPRPPR